MKKIINDDKIYKTLEKNDYYKMTTLAYDLIFKSTYYKKENPFRPYEAVQLLIKAAKNNYAGAFFYLGYLAENGIILFNSLDNALLSADINSANLSLLNGIIIFLDFCILAIYLMYIIILLLKLF